MGSSARQQTRRVATNDPTRPPMFRSGVVEGLLPRAGFLECHCRDFQKRCNSVGGVTHGVFFGGCNGPGVGVAVGVLVALWFRCWCFG